MFCFEKEVMLLFPKKTKGCGFLQEHRNTQYLEMEWEIYNEISKF